MKHHLVALTFAPFATASLISCCTFSAAPGMHMAPQSTIAAPDAGPWRIAEAAAAARLHSMTGTWNRWCQASNGTQGLYRRVWACWNTHCPGTAVPLGERANASAAKVKHSLVLTAQTRHRPCRAR
jgi:hypothetical protein